MIIKPFGEDGISLLQGNIKDDPSGVKKEKEKLRNCCLTDFNEDKNFYNDVSDYICSLLEEPGDYTKHQKLSIQNGNITNVPLDKKIVIDLINKITRGFKKQTKILDIWAVLLKEGDFQLLHSHLGGRPGVSGALYLKIPEMKPPQGNVNFVSEGKVFSWSPKDGDYFVFPAHLIHGVYPFRGPGDRIMISWNSV
jgi:hypothetical protein|tara:strand:+ start:2048 stop:2632 length:585 start_codon:yes stop_codon:yes gene_type:complete